MAGYDSLTQAIGDFPVALAAMIFLALLTGYALSGWLAGAPRRKWQRRRKDRSEFHKLLDRAHGTPAPSFDATEQLRTVMSADFSPRRLLNQSEQRVFRAVEKLLAELESDWRLMAQVSLGEILSSPSEAAFRAINSKRVDMLIVANDGMPLHAIEYQGSGHHLGTAAARDAVKKEALRRAGIGYVEVQAGDSVAELRATLLRLCRAQVNTN